jgi:hypothetical protein
MAIAWAAAAAGAAGGSEPPQASSASEQATAPAMELALELATEPALGLATGGTAWREGRSRIHRRDAILGPTSRGPLLGENACDFNGLRGDLRQGDAWSLDPAVQELGV